MNPACAERTFYDQKNVQSGIKTITFLFMAQVVIYLEHCILFQAARFI